MNIQEKRKRLQELLEQNIKHENVGTAIAITGSWGVGKTYFWNKFLKDVTNKEIEDKKDFYYQASKVNYQSIFDCRKYAYISLFGMENLSDLKNAICTKLTLNPYAKKDSNKWEFSTLFKNTVAQFRDMKVSQYGVSASAKILESLLFLQVKDAIICFDDFERMSNKLDIKDVMGLANQLKLEKNCQIILILDEDKAEGDNKKKYAEYKEKLIDEEIKINSVEPLIRENSTELDSELVELMINFADKLEVHNFRFFQKVINLYRKFRAELPEVVAESTKEIILVRILQGYLINDFQKLEYTWNDSDYFTEKSRETWSETKKRIYNNLYEISYSFVKDDLWLIEFKNWFEQKDLDSNQKILELAQSELINDSNNRKKDKFNDLFKQFWGVTIEEDFSEKLYESAKQVIGLEGLHNLSFALVLLEKLEEFEKATLLENQILEWVKEKLAVNRNYFTEINAFGDVRQSFMDSIKGYKEQNALVGLPLLIEVIHQYLIIQGWSPEHILALEHATKEEWRSVLFEIIQKDMRFENFTSSNVVSKMINQSMKPELNPKIRQMIVEIYKEKGQESEFYKKYMDYLISRLDD